MSRRWIAWVLVVVGLVAPASAQRASTGTLQGVLLDAMQSAIANAVVTVTGPAGVAATTRTDSDGKFAVTLPAGAYAMTLEAPGFAERIERVSIRSGVASPQQFVLQVAGVRESVTITADAGRDVAAITSATRTLTPLRDVPQAVTIISKDLIHEQLMTSVSDVIRYVPGITSHQGENNRDQIVIRGNSSSADFFVNGVRDDVQYYRDLYNLERVEALKGPNALMFGRGGAGGVVNRVMKEADFAPLHELTLQGGQFGHRRMTADLGQPLTGALALRVNGMIEDSDSFRSGVNLQRAGVNPTLTFLPSDRTRVTVGYEYLHDARVADRGITSYQGRPAAVARETFYGNPNDSRVRADVNLASAGIERRIGQRGMLRNRTMAAHYDRFYQNYVPGAPNTDGSRVAITAYNNATSRTNVFNQTDLALSAHTGAVTHTVLVGGEFGRQLTDNFRNTGFFNNSVVSTLVPFSNPLTTTPVTFRQSATDADNHVGARVAAVFIQDQVELSTHLQVLGGLRYDRFDLNFHNNRSGDTLRRPDNLLSPRAGIVVKPTAELSLYSSYSMSYLPSSGDQFSQLTTITQQVKPERFTNYEIGAKWDVRPRLALTSALYRLDRTNTRATDPNDPTRIVQTGSQRTSGFELGLNGAVTKAWYVAGGYAYQDATVVSATTAARAGAQVGQVPHHTFSLWNKYAFHPRASAAVGLIQRADMFAAIDNTVALSGYLKADAALYFALAKQWSLQVNAENITDRKYFLNADSNTNISPGLPRAVRVALTTKF